MLGKDINEFVLEKDMVELKKQFNDKFDSSSVHGMGLNSNGEPVQMDLTFSGPEGMLSSTLLFFLLL